MSTARAASPVADAAAIDDRRDIVVTIENPVLAQAPHAGSNVLGYGASARYRSGQRAMSALDDLKRRHALQEIVGWPIRPLAVYCAVLRPAPGVDRDEVLAALARDPRVRIAEPLHAYEVYGKASGGHGFDDPYLRLQQGFAQIEAPLAQRRSLGEGVEVAIVDTGVDLAHPDLKGRIQRTVNLVDTDARAFNGDRHGTQVAGVIAAVGGNRMGIVGVAPEATVSVYKACWQAGDAGIARCNTFTLAKALAALFDARPRIINMSLGGPRDRLLEQLLSALLRQDRLVIAALPPDGRIGGFPAATAGVLVVGSAGTGGAPAGVIVAPGTDILTTQPDGRYDFASGSSIAAAHVTGIAALLLSIAPQLRARDATAILQRSVGSGKAAQVNAAAAVAALSATRTAQSSAPR
jgi:subtilisin family serine protease